MAEGPDQSGPGEDHLAFTINIRISQHQDTLTLGVLFVVPGQSLKVTCDDENIADVTIDIGRIRYIHREVRDTSPTSFWHASPFIISYCDEDGMVNNIFFNMTDTSREETCLSCLNALRGILRAKYAHTGEETVDQILMILNYQPLFIGQVYTTVSSVGDNQGNVVEGAEALNGFEPLRGKVLLVMDKEGIYLYESSMLVPKYRLMFWSIANPDSIERVKLTCDPTTQANRISLFTRTHSFELVTDRTLVDHIENTRPIKQHLLRDVEILVSSLRELQPRRGVEASGDQPPRPHQYQASSIAPVRHQWEYQADKYVADRNEATKLDGELQSALDQFVGNEETEMMWLALAFDLEEIQSDGKIPLSDHRSGGLDPDNAEHLQRALDDVADQLKSRQLEVALSRIQSCRELFGESKLLEISAIFRNNDDTELLKKIYFRSLCA